MTGAVGRRHVALSQQLAALALVLLAITLTSVASGVDRTVFAAGLQRPDSTLPELTAPVNDFARVIDQANRAAIDRMIRTLQTATGDVVVVATVPTIDPFGDIREYANKLFENNGRGVGDKGKDNGLLIVLAVRERRVQVETGYALEQWITDGFAGETGRDYMVPSFREGRYGDGLRIGTERIIGRIAQGRNVTLDGIRAPAGRSSDSNRFPFVFVIFIILLVLSRIGGGPRGGLRTWGGGGWSGWSSGVGPFGGGWGGGGGGGGFGGGFGGFGGGRSGGGGGGASW